MKSLVYLALAQFVVALHTAFVVFVFFGSLTFRLGRPFRWLHAGCMAYGVLNTIVGWPCPLTILEQRLREMAGQLPYSGEFLPHYFWSHFGFSGSEPAVAFAQIAALLGANVWPYSQWFRMRAARER